MDSALWVSCYKLSVGKQPSVPVVWKPYNSIDRPAKKGPSVPEASGDLHFYCCGYGSFMHAGTSSWLLVVV